MRGTWNEQYRSLITVPAFGLDGRVALLPHRVEEVTELIRAREVESDERYGGNLPRELPSSARTGVAVQAASGDRRQRSVATEVL